MNTKQLQTWKEISGYGGKYLISNLSNCKIVGHLNTTGHKYLTTRVDRAGYATVRLSKDGNTSTKYIHKLVAAAFVPNHMGKPFVNHRNGNKLDNRPKNLEWVTHAENIQHAHDLRLIPRPSERKVIDTCTNKVYPSIKEASKQTGLSYPTVKGYLKGTRRNKTCLKYLDNY